MARRRPTEPTVNPARGAVLVVVAVLVGLFLLRNGIDTSEVVRADGGDDAAVEDDGGDGGDGGETSDTTEPTTPPTLPPAEVPVIVLNGSGVTGAAGNYSDALASAGYQLTNPEGDNADADVTSTQVLYAEGFQEEAAAVAAAIGAPTIVPAALDPAAPPGPIAGASVVVVLGPDLANVTPTTVASTESTATSAA